MAIMDTISAKDAKNNFGKLLMDAQRDPIQIQKHGRPVAVVISAKEYAEMEAMEDSYWSARANEVLKNPNWASKEEVEELFAEIDDAATES